MAWWYHISGINQSFHPQRQTHRRLRDGGTEECGSDGGSGRLALKGWFEDCVASGGAEADLGLGNWPLEVGSEANV